MGAIFVWRKTWRDAIEEIVLINSIKNADTRSQDKKAEGVFLLAVWINGCIRIEVFIMEIQKNKRIQDPAMMKKVREQAKGFCEYCGGFSPSLHVHHLKSKGAGGNDTPDNLIALCFACHHMAHNVEIAKDKLKKIVEERERCVF